MLGGSEGKEQEGKGRVGMGGGEKGKGLNWEQAEERIGEVEEGERWYGEWEKEERERQREIRREKISSARYNR